MGQSGYASVLKVMQEDEKLEEEQHLNIESPENDDKV